MKWAQRVFQRINRWLETGTGYRVTRSGRSGLPSEVVSDPRLGAYYDPGPGNGCSIFAPTDMGLGFNAFVLGQESYHPWIVAVRDAGRSGDRHAIASLLETYYSMVQPESLCDWLDVPTGTCPELDSMPRHAWSVLPWSTKPPDEIIESIEAAQLEENRHYGLNEGMSAGAKAFGPVSGDKLRVEAERIAMLFESLRRYGLDHQKQDYNLRATFLVGERGWTWLSMGGMHRVAMAAATGVTLIPVRVAAVVRRGEVDIWPQVVSGLYDQSTALSLFDRLFERKPPKCALSWIEWVDKHRTRQGTV